MNTLPTSIVDLHTIPYDSTIVKLNINYNMVDNIVPGLIGINLRPHQQTVIRALIDIENKKVIKRKITKHRKSTISTYYSSAMVLSEPFGTGKTFEILALILLNKNPVCLPQYSSIGDILVKKEFIGDNALISCNLIVVGNSVVDQWAYQISTHTNLKMFIAVHYEHIIKLQKLIENGAINNYDVVILKNGAVTGKFDCCKKEFNSTINVVNKITGSRVWLRFILDDFDTSNTSAGAFAINALSTIYVSATQKRAMVDKAKYSSNNNLVKIINKATQIRVVGCVNDSILYSHFNVCNENKFVEQSSNVTIINQHKYVFANPDDNFIRLIGVVGDDMSNNLMEMLNGDAINTAAATVGIRTTSIADIFQRVLNNQYDDYIKNVNAKELTLKFKEYINELPPHEKVKQHSLNKLLPLKNKILSGELNMKSFKYHSLSLEAHINSIMEDFQSEITKVGLAIQRVIDNAKEGMCQICCEELQSIDTFIVKCCGIILCDQCGIKGNHFNTGYNRKDNQTSVVGKCANCHTSIRFDRDLIFLDKNFSIESLLNARGTETEPIIKEEIIEESEPDEIKNPKLRALLHIIKGKPVGSRQDCNIYIDKLLKGVRDIPPTESKNKTVVFASFKETICLIEKFFKEQNIDYIQLHGSASDLAKQIADFKKGPIGVLLINTTQHCAGINLEFCDNLVLFHHITDKNVIGQVVARGQRMLRKSNLQLHFLQYKNEELYTSKYNTH